MTADPACGLPGSRMGWPVSWNGVSLRAWCPRGRRGLRPFGAPTRAGCSRSRFRAMLWLMKYTSSTLHAGEDLLERLEHEGVDEQVVHRREVGTERHVVEVRVRLRVPSGAYTSGGRCRAADIPRFELALQRLNCRSASIAPHPRLPQCERNAARPSRSPNVVPTLRARSLSATARSRTRRSGCRRRTTRAATSSPRRASPRVPRPGCRESRVARAACEPSCPTCVRVLAALRPLGRDANSRTHACDAPSVTRGRPMEASTTRASLGRVTLSASRSPSACARRSRR
jgi:hypothetical protein